MESLTDNSLEYDVPLWEHQYIHGGEQFPNEEVRKFYNTFKEQFFLGHYLDLKGNTNYSFYLMYDILGIRMGDMLERVFTGDKEEIERYLPILAEKYPETQYYCEGELGKREICTKRYKDEDYFLFNSTNSIYTVKVDFENKEDILIWLSDSDEFRVTGSNVFVNSKGLIDVINDDSKRLYGNEKRGCRVLPLSNQLPEYIKFNLVEGNFKYLNYGWNSVKNYQSGYQGGEVEPHDITNLVGCPQIVRGNFIAKQLGLTSLENGPCVVNGNFDVSHNKISSFIGIPKLVGGCLDLSDNELTDESWEYAKENIEGEFNDYKIGNNKFVKYRRELY